MLEKVFSSNSPICFLPKANEARLSVKRMSGGAVGRLLVVANARGA